MSSLARGPVRGQSEYIGRPLIHTTMLRTTRARTSFLLRPVRVVADRPGVTHYLSRRAEPKGPAIRASITVLLQRRVRVSVRNHGQRRGSDRSMPVRHTRVVPGEGECGRDEVSVSAARKCLRCACADGRTGLIRDDERQSAGVRGRHAIAPLQPHGGGGANFGCRRAPPPTR